MSKLSPPLSSSTAAPVPVTGRAAADRLPAKAEAWTAGDRPQGPPARSRACATYAAIGVSGPFAAAVAAFMAGALQLAILAFAGGFITAVAASIRYRHDRRTDAVIARRISRAAVVTSLDRALIEAPQTGRSIGAFVLEIDNYRQFEERHCHEDRAALLAECEERLARCIGEDDVLGRTDGPSFFVSHVSEIGLDLEKAIRFATGLQSALSAPVTLGTGNIYPSVSIGFALSDRSETPTGDSLLQSAMTAMIEAQRSGTGAIRSFSAVMRNRIEARAKLVGEVRAALENGQISPFFQPQTATDTGALTGFETLARWHHPERGMIPPSDFLPAIEEAGLMEDLGTLMTREALSAMRQWEDAGLYVPQVGVNFSTYELSNPGLADEIAQALRDFDLTPDRLTIEVLETVVAGQQDHFVARNLSRLADMGCRLDLDDFGTGHASITAIRRFCIARIKIDRTFVTRIDEDEEQQDMVAAILTMAERLGLEALAEGVETAAEHAMLRQLGCAYVQGFGIARPMPLSDTFDWIEGYSGRADAPVALRARSA